MPSKSVYLDKTGSQTWINIVWIDQLIQCAKQFWILNTIVHRWIIWHSCQKLIIKRRWQTKGHWSPLITKVMFLELFAFKSYIIPPIFKSNYGINGKRMSSLILLANLILKTKYVPGFSWIQKAMCMLIANGINRQPPGINIL